MTVTFSKTMNWFILSWSLTECGNNVKASNDPYLVSVAMTSQLQYAVDQLQCHGNIVVRKQKEADDYNRSLKGQCE